MVYITDYYDSDQSLELTANARKALRQLELPTEFELTVMWRATILAYCEKVDAVHARHIKQAWRDRQKEELDNLAEKMENHDAIVIT